LRDGAPITAARIELCPRAEAIDEPIDTRKGVTMGWKH
jgi:hypothetical protein